MEYETIAAVDLGSNSFRLQVGRVVNGQIYTLDSLKETVRLASGLTPERLLDEAAIGRGLEALHRFGERLRGLDEGAVRAVATNTLRVAKNAHAFLTLGEAALGFPIEVIAGREEARLIYVGAIHSLPPSEEKRLVVDIGGGSTEFIVGQKTEPLLLESLYMGCVGYTLRFFPDDQVDKKRLKEAQIAAAKEIRPIAQRYREMGWQEALGASGTARALTDLLEQNRLNPGDAPGITRAGLEKLALQLVKAGSTRRFNAQGVRPDRQPVLPGGLAIMLAVFDELDLAHMQYVDGALRQGVLYDLIGRYQQHDMRDVTVRQFMERYQVDEAQAHRVKATALALLAQLQGSGDSETERHTLAWAADLHETGISVAHNGYHKHGAYILTYADMPGFSKKDQARLATLILGHRGKLERLATLPAHDPGWRLIFALRLSALLHRNRDDRPLPPLEVKRPFSGGFQLELPQRWLENNPSTRMALKEEIAIWEATGMRFKVRAVATPKAPAGTT